VLARQACVPLERAGTVFAWSGIVGLDENGAVGHRGPVTATELRASLLGRIGGRYRSHLPCEPFGTTHSRVHCVQGECENFMMIKGHKLAVTDVHWTTDGQTLIASGADQVRLLGDAKSSLGDAESSLGDAKSSRGVTLRARWVTLRARGVPLRARWVTLRALAG
jgi:hypothetical protein